MTTRHSIHKSEYLKAAENRLQDAAALKEKNRHHAMVYMLGYVLECALAYGYCMRNDKAYIQDVRGYNESVWKDHNRLIDKLGATGMHDLLGDLKKIANEWHVEMRYAGNQYNSTEKQQKANELFALTRKLFVAIKHKSV